MPPGAHGGVFLIINLFFQVSFSGCRPVRRFRARGRGRTGAFSPAALVRLRGRTVLTGDQLRARSFRPRSGSRGRGNGAATAGSERDPRRQSFSKGRAHPCLLCRILQKCAGKGSGFPHSEVLCPAGSGSGGQRKEKVRSSLPGWPRPVRLPYRRRPRAARSTRKRDAAGRGGRDRHPSCLNNLGRVHGFPRTSDAETGSARAPGARRSKHALPDGEELLLVLAVRRNSRDVAGADRAHRLHGGRCFHSGSIFIKHNLSENASAFPEKSPGGS